MPVKSDKSLVYPVGLLYNHQTIFGLFFQSVCVWVCGGGVRFGDCYYLGHHLVRAEIKSK